MRNQLLNNKILPKNCLSWKLDKLGFTFGEVCDELFIRTTFPCGWLIHTADNQPIPNETMLYYLLDNLERIRGMIIYIENSSASVQMFTRYLYTWVYDNNLNIFDYIITDCDKEIYRIPNNNNLINLTIPDTWLDKHYPNWRDHLAYW